MAVSRKWINNLNKEGAIGHELGSKDFLRRKEGTAVVEEIVSPNKVT